MVFKQATSPGSWTDGDVWIDTSGSPRVLNINNNGTALVIPSSGNIVNADIKSTAAIALSKLATSPLSTITQQTITLGAGFTSNNNGFIDITGMTLTMPTRTGGKAHLAFIVEYTTAAIADTVSYRVVDNAVNQPQISQQQMVNGNILVITIPYETTLAGQIVKLQINPGATSCTVSAESYITSYEIS